MSSGQSLVSTTGAAKAGDILLVIHDFVARSPDELSLLRGELIELIEKDDDFGDGWYLGRHFHDGRTGLFPEVYTKLAPAPVAHPPESRASRSSTLTRNTPASMTESTSTAQQQPGADITSREHYNLTAPAPLNTPAGNQRAVSAPTNVSPTTSTSTAPASQRNISMVMNQTRDPERDSPVITETLGVIDEHITEMNTPRSSFLASPRNKNNDSGSDYSSYVDHRLSYITGNETDEEESLTYEEVVNWNPAQLAQYLHEIGVEQRHCDVFQEQEITGAVLLNLEKSELFMPELELGPIGRRLATWHKIKAFQEEVKSKRGSTAAPSVSGSAGASQHSATGPSAYIRVGESAAQRSSSYRFSQQHSPMIPEDDQLGITRYETGDSGPAPAATKFGHSRRHSSLEYSKTDRGTPPIGDATKQPSGHRQQGSFDKTWTLTSPQAQAGNRTNRASTMLGLGALGMATPGLPTLGDRSSMTGSTADLDGKLVAPPELDRGYLSSGEVEGSGGKIRNLLRKTRPNSTNHSRQNSGKDDNRSIFSASGTKRHSRFGSAGSIFNTMNAQLETHPTLGHQKTAPSPQLSRSESKALARGDTLNRARTLSLRGDSSSASGPSTTTTLAGTGKQSFPPSAPLPGENLFGLNTPDGLSLMPTPSLPEPSPSGTTPIVTKLDYTESPTSLNSRSNPVSPLIKSENFGAAALGRMTSTFSRAGKRSSSDAVTNVEKSQISSPIVPTTVVEAPLQSPTRTGSTTPSAASKSIEIDSTPDASIKGAAPNAAQRTGLPNTTKRSKNKKDTSAYRSLQVISPQLAKLDCAHSGWMHKKSAKMTSTFKSRYFVLKDKRLSYFYSLDDKIEKGLIDINAHRVEQVENDLITSLYATLAGTKSSPVSPANAPSAPGTTPSSGYGQGGPFFFKLVPPRSGLSRAVQFTRPAVHFFAVDNYEDGREWFLALKKASIDRDETQPIASTYTQKTISLAKAQQQRQRPPALMNLENVKASTSEEVKSPEDIPLPADETSVVDSLNIGYDPSALAIGKPDIAAQEVVQQPATDASLEEDANLQRPQSEQPSASLIGEKLPTTLRLVRSFSNGLFKQHENHEENAAAEITQ